MPSRLPEPSPREGDRSRGGVRDPPAAADGHVGEGAAAGRRAADPRSDRRQHRRCRRGRRGARRHERAQGSRGSTSGRRVTTSSIHDDGTTSNEDRLGAIGDMLFVVEQAELDDDLLVIAGDNLFEFELADLVAFWSAKGVASAVAVRDVGSLELASHYGVVDLADDGRMLSFVEKPADPPSTPRCDRDLRLPSRACAPDPAVPRRRARLRPAGPLRRLAPASRARLRLGVRRRAGTTSGTTSSCSKPTTGFASPPACRRATAYSPD